MGKIQRARHIITGILFLVSSVILLNGGEKGFGMVLLLLTLSLIIYGLRLLGYYFNMAKHMVGGKEILYRGLLIFDFGLITLSLSGVPNFYLMLYILGVHLFSGVIDILRALEAKRIHGSSWKINFVHGIINTVIVAICIVFINRADMVVYIYSAGLFYSGIERIVRTFKKTAIVYVP